MRVGGCCFGLPGLGPSARAIGAFRMTAGDGVCSRFCTAPSWWLFPPRRCVDGRRNPHGPNNSLGCIDDGSIYNGPNVYGNGGYSLGDKDLAAVSGRRGLVVLQACCKVFV